MQKQEFHALRRASSLWHCVPAVLGAGLCLLAGILLLSCDDGASADDVPAVVKATEIPKKQATDIRDSYVLFSISADKDLTDYHLAVEETANTAPTAAVMASDALKRNFGTEAINVLIAQRLDAPMVRYAKDLSYETRTLGTGMVGDSSDDNNVGVVFDHEATGGEAWVAESVLKSATAYTLYGMANGGSTVSALLSFTTDSLAGESIPEGFAAVDSSLIKAYLDGEGSGPHPMKLSIRDDEYYIFPLQAFVGSGSPSLLYYLVNDVVQFSYQNTRNTNTPFGYSTPRDEHMVLSRDSVLSESVKNGGLYLLFQTIPGRYTSPEFWVSGRVNTSPWKDWGSPKFVRQ